jgi:hypothetical protein
MHLYREVLILSDFAQIISGVMMVILIFVNWNDDQLLN